MQSKTFQAKLTLEGTAEQIEHALLAVIRDIQAYNYHRGDDRVLFKIGAYGYEDILVDSELKAL